MQTNVRVTEGRDRRESEIRLLKYDDMNIF